MLSKPQKVPREFETLHKIIMAIITLVSSIGGFVITNKEAQRKH